MTDNLSPRQRNAGLAALVAAGDGRARERLIEDNMALVRALVSNHVRAYPHLAYMSDDMTSEGFVALTTAVNKITDGATGDNPTAYMTEYVLCAIRETADRHSGNGASPRTQRRARSKGTDLPKQAGSISPQEANQHDPAALIDLRDQVYSVAQIAVEHQLLRLFEEGHSASEVASKLKMPLSSVYATRQRLYARWIARQTDDA